MINYDTIKKYSDAFSNVTQHPLINLVDFSKSGPIIRTKFTLNFYAIIIKDTRCGDLRYGNQYYDYADGTMVFFSPGQIIAHEPENEVHQPYGRALIFHPDLIKNTSLGRQIHEYSFFNYQSHEALHLSEKEKETITTCFTNVAVEIGQNIDRHTRQLIVANLELLLKYASRFYDRQFITREHVHHSILEQFELKLNAYLEGEQLRNEGVPTVAFFANELNLSPNYFGDLIKRETGKSALEFIHLHLISLAKERITDYNKSVSEVAYELGFKYPQHFTRFFKQRVGVSPHEYRSLN